MREGSFLKIIIVCLLVLNLGTLGYLWTGRGGKHDAPPGRPPRENTGEYLRRNLSLTDEQENQYRAMRESHHRMVMDIRDKMHGFQERLYKSLSSTTIDSNNVKMMADSIAAGQHDIETITFYHFRDLRKICTPQQQQRFDLVIGEALERLRGRGGGRPPRD